MVVFCSSAGKRTAVLRFGTLQGVVLAPAEPMGSEERRLELRVATDADREYARVVHHGAYRAVVERQFGAWDEEAQDGFFARQWAPGEQHVIVVSGVERGYCDIESREEDIHLRELVIDPDHQGQGIGSLLIGDLQRQASERGVPVRLGVFKENRAAELYVRLGFVRIGETETHVLMEWNPAVAR